MSDANEVQVLLKPSRKVAKRTVSTIVTVGIVGIPFLLLVNADEGGSPRTLLLVWGVVCAMWIAMLLVHYWVLLRDEHGLMFARGDTIYERTGSFMLWRRSKPLIECGPGHEMTIELAEAYQRNEHTYEMWRPSERVEIRLSNGSQTAEIRPKRHDVEDGWNDKFHHRFDEWQQSIGADPQPSTADNSGHTIAASLAPTAAPASSGPSLTGDGGAAADGTYPLLFANTDRIKHHMFWATVRWIGGFLVTWLLAFAVLMLISDSTVMVYIGLIGVPAVLAVGTFLVLRSYHRIGHDSSPMLYGTDTAVYQRAGGLLKPRYSKVLLELTPGQPMVIKNISRLGLEELNDDDRHPFRSWWNLQAQITLSNGTGWARWRSRLFLVEDNWRVRFRRRFKTWQADVSPATPASQSTESTAR